MDIIKAHAINNLCYIAAQKMRPEGIVVHSTGANNPTLKRYVNCPEEVGENKRGNHWDIPKPEGKSLSFIIQVNVQDIWRNLIICIIIHVVLLIFIAKHYIILSSRLRRNTHDKNRNMRR